MRIAYERFRFAHHFEREPLGLNDHEESMKSTLSIDISSDFEFEELLLTLEQDYNR